MSRFVLVMAVGAAVVASGLIAHVALGTVPIGLRRIALVLAGMAESPVDHAIVWGLRLPRALVALAAGAMLGLAGALLQTVTRNPLAEPGLMGVSGGATLAIVATIVAGSRIEGAGIIRETGMSLALIGVLGGMAAGSLSYGLSLRGGSDPTLLVLMGVLVAGTAASLSALVLLLAEENQARLVLHWMVGSTGGRVWVHWRMIWPLAAVGIGLGLSSAGIANALQLGDSVAAGLGLRVELARFWLIFIAAILTAGAVAVVGAIGFVGLIGPHLARLLVGNDARRLFPASLVVSAALLLVADIAARLISLGWLAELTGLALPGRSGLPAGAVMPMLGVPFLLYLLLGRRT